MEIGLGETFYARKDISPIPIRYLSEILYKIRQIIPRDGSTFEGLNASGLTVLDFLEKVTEELFSYPSNQLQVRLVLSRSENKQHSGSLELEIKIPLEDASFLPLVKHSSIKFICNLSSEFISDTCFLEWYHPISSTNTTLYNSIGTIFFADNLTVRENQVFGINKWYFKLDQSFLEHSLPIPLDLQICRYNATLAEFCLKDRSLAIKLARKLLYKKGFTEFDEDSLTFTSPQSKRRIRLLFLSESLLFFKVGRGVYTLGVLLQQMSRWRT